jgi:hypothetical protein
LQNEGGVRKRCSLVRPGLEPLQSDAKGFGHKGNDSRKPGWLVLVQVTTGSEPVLFGTAEMSAEPYSG